jgi:hypothetical protein
VVAFIDQWHSEIQRELVVLMSNDYYVDLPELLLSRLNDILSRHSHVNLVANVRELIGMVVSFRVEFKLRIFKLYIVLGPASFSRNLGVHVAKHVPLHNL